MSDQPDPLFLALGELERERERDYPSEWEDVLGGRSPADAAVAARKDVDEPEALAVYQSAFTGAIADAEVDGLVARLAAAPASEPPPAKVVPLRRRGWFAAAGGILAVAAALVLWFPSVSPRVEVGAYDFAVLDSDVRVDRKDRPASETPRYHLDSTIDWVVRPAHAVAAAVELRVVAEGPGGARVLAPPVPRSPEGSFRLRGRLADLLALETGRWRLRILVCAPGAAPAGAVAADAALAEGAAVLAGELTIELLPARGGG